MNQLYRQARKAIGTVVLWACFVVDSIPVWAVDTHGTRIRCSSGFGCRRGWSRWAFQYGWGDDFPRIGRTPSPQPPLAALRDDQTPG